MKSVLVKAICLCLMVILIVPLLSGCLNPDDISEFAYVLAIGVDAGKQFKYNISFLMQTAAPSAETPQANQTTIVAAEGDNVYEAIDIAEEGMPHRMNFSRVNMLLFSMECAEKGLLEDFFRLSWSTTKIRTSANLVITTERADDFLKGLNSDNNSSFSKLQNILVDYSKATGFINAASVFDYIRSLNNRMCDAVLPLGAIDESIEEKKEGGSSGSGSAGSGSTGGGFGETEPSAEPSPTKDTTSGTEREGGTKSYFSGSALFDGAKMVGVITGEETQLLLMAYGKLNGARVSLINENQMKYTLRLANVKDPKVSVSISEDRIDVVYNIFLGVRLEMELDKEQLEEMRQTGGLLQSMADQVVDYSVNGLNRLFNDCKELNCDAFKIGKYVSLKFFSTKEWEDFNFKSRYKTVYVTFNVSINMEDVFVSSYID